MSNYTPIIGLEVHIELSTASKMFCGCPADHFGKAPNTQVCPVCMGLPGALPFANKKAIESTISFGLAFDCKISQESKFDRKHYFYPDLPKGYQISQYDLPLCTDGVFKNTDQSSVRIKRVHLEEDTGKLIHQTVDGKKVSLIDFNRSSVPLMEMVTEPDFNSAESVDAFLKEIQLVVRALKISSADMEKGSMRLEANISLATEQQVKDLVLPSYKVELKNINSFRFLKKAIQAEIERQSQILSDGEMVIQETRGYDEDTETTFSQRVKEEANDYRYFPEPDIPPLHISEEDVENIRRNLPELPIAKRVRFASDYQLSSDYIQVFITDYDRCAYFENAVALGAQQSLSPKMIAGVIINQNMDKQYPEPAGLVKALVEISQKEYASAGETKAAIEKVIKENPDAVEKYKSGKVQIIGFLLGMVQKELQGTGNPKDIQSEISSQLNR